MCPRPVLGVSRQFSHFLLGTGNKRGPAVFPRHQRSTRPGSTPPCPRPPPHSQRAEAGSQLGPGDFSPPRPFPLPRGGCQPQELRDWCVLIALRPVSAVREQSPAGAHWSCWLRFCHWAASWAEPKGLYPPHPAWRSPPLACWQPCVVSGGAAGAPICGCLMAGNILFPPIPSFPSLGRSTSRKC